MSNQIETNMQNAEIYKGNSVCTQKFRQLLSEMNLPKGLVALDNTIEFGYNRSTGFVWLKQDKKAQHRSRTLGSVSAYDTEITGFLENYRMKEITGVKSKVILVWVPLTDIFIDDPSSGKITFVISSGLSKSYPLADFELNDDGIAQDSAK